MFLLSGLTVLTAANSTEASAVSPSPAVRIDSDTCLEHIQVSAARATPRQVVDALAGRFDVDIRVEQLPVTTGHIALDGSLEHVLGELLGHRNWILSYAPRAGCATPVLKGVRVLASSTPTQNVPIAVANDTRTGMPADSRTADALVEHTPEPARALTSLPAPVAETPSSERPRAGSEPVAIATAPQQRGRMSPAERSQEREQRRMDQQKRDAKAGK